MTRGDCILMTGFTQNFLRRYQDIGILFIDLPLNQMTVITGHTFRMCVAGKVPHDAVARNKQANRDHYYQCFFHVIKQS